MRRLIAAVFAMAVGWVWPAGADTEIWIDTDAACDEGLFVDVDDCWALGLALSSPDIDVRGVSNVFGNADGQETYNKILEVVELAGSAAMPPVYRGADGPSPIDATSAVAALANALEANELTIVALGPLTNVAALIDNHPKLSERLTRVIAVMGKQQGEVFDVGANPLFHLHDMNVRKDPDAVRTVLESGVPLTVMTFGASADLVITPDDLEWLRNGGGFGQQLANMSAPWLAVWRHVFWADGFRPFDALTVLYLMKPEAFDCHLVTADVTPERLLTTFSIALEVNRSVQRNRQITFCDQADSSLHPLLLRSLAQTG